MMKKRVRVSVSRLIIRCVPDQLERDYFTELNKIADEKNQEFKENLAQRERYAQREREHTEVRKAGLDNLNNIKFD